MKISRIGIAWYKRENYDSLRRLFADGESLPETFDDWLRRAETGLDQFRAGGQTVEKVDIDPDVFPAWCAARGLDVNSEARRRFCAEAAARKQAD